MWTNRGIGISTEMIERALNDIGCLCMGQQHLKQLFVLETVNDRTDKVKKVFLRADEREMGLV